MAGLSGERQVCGQEVFRMRVPSSGCAAKGHPPVGSWEEERKTLQAREPRGKCSWRKHGWVAVVLFSVGWTREPLLGIVGTRGAEGWKGWEPARLALLGSAWCLV